MDTEALSDAYEKAPPVLQDYLESEEFDQTVIELAGSFGLPISSYVPIKNACTLVILGVIEARELVDSFQEVLGLKTEVARNLTRSIDGAVFNTVRTLLQTIQPRANSKEIAVGTVTIPGQTLRASILEQKEVVDKSTQNTPLAGSRAMLMDQLSLIGQIPKDEDVLARLSKIKEQLRKGEQVKEKIDEDIRERERQERLKRVEVVKVTVPRRVYDVDPYREGVGEEEL